MSLPSSILNAPDLLQGLEFYYLAFMDLTTDRPVSYYGEGAISWFRIREYGLIHGIEQEEELEDLIYHIQQMDSVYLKFRRDEAKPKGA